MLGLVGVLVGALASVAGSYYVRLRERTRERRAEILLVHIPEVGTVLAQLDKSATPGGTLIAVSATLRRAALVTSRFDFDHAAKVHQRARDGASALKELQLGFAPPTFVPRPDPAMVKYGECVKSLQRETFALLSAYNKALARKLNRKSTD